MTSNDTSGRASSDRALLGMAGIGMALFGALFFVYFIGQLASGGNGRTPVGVNAGLVVFFGGMLTTGVWLAWWAFRAKPTADGTARPATGTAPAGERRTARPTDDSRGRRAGGPARHDTTRWPDPPSSPAERERRVLRLAERERGRVTVPEVAAQCGLSIAEAKTELDRLVSEGVADLHVTASGILVYVFVGFLSDEEKARATDI
jgi:hypothetical protein